MNIVYMFADQLRRQSCGYAGDSRAKTPNIDKLSRESCELTNAVSGHPVCAPYRASLFTGKYTTSTGMVINELRISPEHDTIAKVLDRAGYETAYIGKWHLALLLVMPDHLHLIANVPSGAMTLSRRTPR